MNDVILEMVIYKELFLGVLFFILSVYENYLEILGGFFLGGGEGFNKRKRFLLLILFVKNCKGKLLIFVEVLMEVLVVLFLLVVMEMFLLWGE